MRYCDYSYLPLPLPLLPYLPVPVRCIAFAFACVLCTLSDRTCISRRDCLLLLSSLLEVQYIFIFILKNEYEFVLQFHCHPCSHSLIASRRASRVLL
jgi:hypothetical protein